MFNPCFCIQVLELDKNGTAGGNTSTELLRRQLSSATEKVHDLEVSVEKKEQVAKMEFLFIDVFGREGPVIFINIGE